MDSEAVFITKKLLFAVLIIFSMAIFCSNTLYATNETQIANGTNITFNETTIEYNNSIDSTTLAENTGNYTNSTVNRTENNDENSTNAENATAAAGENNYTNIHGIWIPSDIALSLTSANVTQLMNAGITDVYIKCNINPNSNNPYNTVLNYVVALFKNSGIRINAWITCFQDSNGNWIDPSNTTRKNEILTAITDIVKKYGVSGVNLDYVRYPGTAYKYTNGTQTITSFVASVYSTVKSINPNIAISADLMPEGSVNAYYYGQDYSALSQYLDYLIPMIYKGNYNKDTAWIGTTTQYIVNHSNGKPVIAGILTYISDSNVTKLSPEVLAADVNQAMNNGASGYALFRYGLTSSYPVTYTPVTFTLDQILNAATSVKTYIETNKKLPDTVTIDGRTISISQFLYLATQATIKINSGNYSSITTGSFSTPSSGYDNLVAGQITLANYVDFAQRIVQHMNWNGVAPNYGRVTIGSNTGEVSYQAQIYLYSRILAYYKTNGTLPTSLTVKSWSTANIPITEPSKFTITQITTAAAWLKTYIETNKTLPSTITVGTTTMDLADFLYLATQATV
ncbi:MAG: pseudomurein-binding repeat-containing protein, partial [Methanobacterium sp.]